MNFHQQDDIQYRGTLIENLRPMTDFKEFERTAWEEKAHRYDASWGQVSTQVIGPILDLVQPLQGRSLLDCGCGPGHLCAEAAKRGATVTGCDYSHRMLEIAKEKYPNISYVHQ